MQEPNCPQKAPYKLDLKPNTYYWCACGNSKNQPFCDGSHKGSDFSPLPFEITDEKSYYICGCKKTNNPPFCDGAHKKL